MQKSPYHRAMDEGRIAKRNGKGRDENPYHPYLPSLAGAWWTGYDDEGEFKMDTAWAARIVYGGSV